MKKEVPAVCGEIAESHVFGMMFSSMLASREIEENMKRLLAGHNIFAAMQAHA